MFRSVFSCCNTYKYSFRHRLLSVRFEFENKVRKGISNDSNSTLAPPEPSVTVSTSFYSFYFSSVLSFEMLSEKKILNTVSMKIIGAL